MDRPPLDDALDALLAGAGDDDERLDLLAAHIADVCAHLKHARATRNQVALRLRAAGQPMLDIARRARVGDSYLSRQAIGGGLPRRVDRTRGAGAA